MRLRYRHLKDIWLLSVSWLLESMPLLPLLSLLSARRNSLFPGLRIDTRLVIRVLGFERVVCGSSHALIGFSTQDLLQRSNSAGISWLRAQPTDSGLSYPSIGIVLRYLNEETNEIS